ncbi:PREDICTED: THAP domain-containing protein 5-like [Wasmannia auropunctata]|uniref:THAP domain-containing protein 5-like n=1 Tax=Wasmannia auropunctata TaxID=64793 RepID=UPI0005F04454|nr:PREDICTED: THAP domain-containing protein 5-like [Wasmannia auropunctata]
MLSLFHKFSFEMPGCAAPYCTNSAAKGYKMCYFPTNQERCSVWVANMHRDNWTPTKYSTLCQVHFAPEAWEQHRADGLLKLKQNAVPTLFGELVPGSSQQPSVSPFKGCNKICSRTQEKQFVDDSLLQNTVPAAQNNNKLSEAISLDHEDSDTNVSSESTASENDRIFVKVQKTTIRTKKNTHTDATEKNRKTRQMF